MLRDADPQLRSTLLQEFPAYFEAGGLPIGWIDDVAAQADPELAQAQQCLTNGQQAKICARQNAELLRKGIQNACPPTSLIDPSRFDPDR
jgi:hypothetical protein